MYSVVILTLNEERNLAACLDSVRASDEVVVLDSGSTDRTHAIAAQRGVRVVVRSFDDFAGQRNYAQREIRFRHPWVFHLDADERFTPELEAECLRVSESAPPDVDGFWVAPKMIFRGRWIRRCTDYPAYQARFVRAPEFRFIQVGHGQREAPEMRLRALSNSYLHDLSADGEAALLEKHRRYSRQEALEHLRRAAAEPVQLGQLFSSQPLERRRALKRLSHRLPARGLFRFVYQYLLRRGLLDGSEGFAYCCLLARYEHWIGREMARLRRQPPL